MGSEGASTYSLSRECSPAPSISTSSVMPSSPAASILSTTTIDESPLVTPSRRLQIRLVFRARRDPVPPQQRGTPSAADTAATRRRNVERRRQRTAERLRLAQAAIMQRIRGRARASCRGGFVGGDRNGSPASTQVVLFCRKWYHTDDAGRREILRGLIDDLDSRHGITREEYWARCEHIRAMMEDYRRPRARVN